jgi:Phosphotransferase enzyme family
VDALTGVVAGELSRSDTTAVDEKVFGTNNPEVISEIVGRFCQDHLESKPQKGLFYRSSVGCVIGVRLATGADVVVKAYQERWSQPFLSAIQTVQQHLAQQGFSCPAPMLSARPIAPGSPNLAVAETCLFDPGISVPNRPGARRVSAAGLARQIDWCRELPDLSGLQEHPLRRPVGGLYPEPHSPLFDFAGTTESAQWIDKFAAKAAELRERDQGPLLAAHTDWSARNVRLGDQAVVAVYDWDSVALVPESTAVGQAAVTWSVTFERGGSGFPSASQIVSFIHDYEMAAGQPFSDEQWRATGAAATWLLAYSARCEHALAMTGRARPDQRGARDRLALDGDDLLELTSRRSPPE